MKRIITLLLLITFYNINAQSTKGNLAGKIIDKATNEEIIGATVAVEGTSTGATTDLDGKFFLKLDPGTYTIVVSYVSYKTKKYVGIEIKAGELTPLNVGLDENSTELEEVVVQGEARKESAAGLLLQQKNAVAVSSGISADLIRKMPDRTTADVIKRISGTSIQDGKFAIIRGLGDRYNYGMINGAPLPSSETDRKAFSLDIVPAQVVDNIVISKTATSDMPGDFAGGIIQINTREIPDENMRFINIGGGYNTLTTFKDFSKSPQSSSTDWLGFDNGPRQLPQGAYPQNIARSGTLNLDQLVSQTKLFNNQFGPQQTTAKPNLAFQLGGSQRLKLLGNDFGVIAALTYNSQLKYTPGSIISTPTIDVKNQNSFEGFQYANYYNNVQNYKTSTNIGGILNFSYKVGQNNKFFLKNMITQTSDDQTTYRTGYQIFSGSPSFYNNKDYSYYYASNRMISSQFSGEHFMETSKIRFKYIIGYNNLYRNVPDYKRLFYQQVADSSQIFAGAPNSNPYSALLNQSGGGYNPNNVGRFYSKMNENSVSGNVEASIPFFFIGKQEVKVGYMTQYRSRDFTARNFNLVFNPITRVDNSADTLGVYQITQDQNISKTRIFQNETTQPTDQYTASSQLNAAFIMFDSKFAPWFKLNYGLRLESFNQKLNSIGNKALVDVTWTDPLPSVNAIISPTDKMNFRASYSRTLSRPEFREFAPLAFYDFNTNAIIVGNPKLNRANINNFDVKWEFFPIAGTTFSINPFAKQFNNPIEFINKGGQGSNQSFGYGNATSAFNYGVELETRFTLQALGSKFFNNVTLFANLALIQSQVSINVSDTASGQDRYRLSDYNKRPLQGQSPYVFNAGFSYTDDVSGWDFTLSMNQVGKRIAYVGDTYRQTIWENPRFILDASITKTINKFKIRAILNDLLAQNLVFYYDLNKDGIYNEKTDLAAFKYRNGQTFSFQAIYSF